MIEAIAIPRDAAGDPLAWPVPTGGYVDAWNGWYPTLAFLLREVDDWTADEADRVLAYGDDLKDLDR